MEETQVITDQSTVTIEMPAEDMVSSGNPTEPVQEQAQPLSNEQIAAMARPGEAINSAQETSANAIGENVLHVTPEIAENVAATKHPGGRPCGFCERSEEIQTKTQEYFDRCSGKTGKPTIPFIEELALELGTTSQTVWNWGEKKLEDGSLEHEEFFDTIKRLKDFQKLRLLQRTLGRYNPTGAIFQLKANHGLIETEKQILAGSQNEPVDIRIIEDRQIGLDK